MFPVTPYSTTTLSRWSQVAPGEARPSRAWKGGRGARPGGEEAVPPAPVLTGLVAPCIPVVTAPQNQRRSNNTKTGEGDRVRKYKNNQWGGVDVGILSEAHRCCCYLVLHAILS